MAKFKNFKKFFNKHKSSDVAPPPPPPSPPPTLPPIAVSQTLSLSFEATTPVSSTISTLPRSLSSRSRNSKGSNDEAEVKVKKGRKFAAKVKRGIKSIFNFKKTNDKAKEHADSADSLHVEEDFCYLPTVFEEDAEEDHGDKQLVVYRPSESNLSGAIVPARNYARVNSELDDISTIIQQLYSAFYHQSVVDARRNVRFGLPVVMGPYRCMMEVVLNWDWEIDDTKEMVEVMFKEWMALVGHDSETPLIEEVFSETDEESTTSRDASLAEEAETDADDTADPETQFPTFEVPLSALSEEVQEIVDEIVEDDEEVPPKLQFKVIRYLGGGCSGSVYAVRERLTGESFALKVAPKDKNEEHLDFLLRERYIGERLQDDPLFASFVFCWHDTMNFYFVMEKHPFTLDRAITVLGKIDRETARFYLGQLILALEALHERGIIHRDVKASNILIRENGNIVLADFGLAIDFGEAPTMAERGFQPYMALGWQGGMDAIQEFNWSQVKFVTNEYVGSKFEFSPEAAQGFPYSFPVDYWGSAIVLYEMRTGHPPFYTDDDDDIEGLMDMIVNEPVTFETTDDVYDDERDFIEQMLQKNPADRLDIETGIKNHPYFRDIDWVALKAGEIPLPQLPAMDGLNDIDHTDETDLESGEVISHEDDDLGFTFVSDGGLRKIVRGLLEPTTIEAESSGPSVADSTFVITPNPEVGTFNDQGASSEVEGEVEANEGDIDVGEEAKPLMVIKWDHTQINKVSTQPCGPGRPGAIFEHVVQSSESQDTFDEDIDFADEVDTSATGSTEVNIEEFVEEGYQFVEVPPDMPEEGQEAASQSILEEESNVLVVWHERKKSGLLAKLKHFFTWQRTKSTPGPTGSRVRS